ncbi:hypothetical protein E2562_029432 [Oryza meyeriana var. granulata]|uniref:Uncharacterized protein n=1 Tax=Oryza meyeriana var. granulata TaxID=110450 RepID=A0A6G1C011_9ORYZ|nr:hypothetical protein E2562_029432 [Oryza meyeriana var. granulata]
MAKSSNLKEQCKEVSIPFITSKEEVASDKQDGGSHFQVEIKRMHNGASIFLIGLFFIELR